MALEPEGIFDDAELATDSHFLGIDAAANCQWGALRRVDEVGRLELRHVVRVAEVVVVVGDDGVLLTLVGDEHCTLRTLDVKPVNDDVSRRLTHLDSR